MRSAAIFLFSLVTVQASTRGALTVRNLSIESGKQQVTFDLANVSAKAVRSWTMTIDYQKKSPDRGLYSGSMSNTSERCSPSGSPMAPQQSRGCTVSLQSADRAGIIGTEVTVTAVLFWDGSAEGDLALLDRMAHSRRASTESLEFWIPRLEPALADPTIGEQLQAMQKVLSVADAELPPGLRYDPFAAWERRNLVSQVDSGLTQPSALVAALKQRLDELRTSADPFPARRGVNPEILPADSLRDWTVVSNTSALRLVAVRESIFGTENRELFLQNVSHKAVTAISVSFDDSHPGSQTETVDCFPRVCVGPGASHNFTDADPRRRTLVIKAVVFDDGTGEGMRGEVDAFLFRRLGASFETQRMSNLLRRPSANVKSLSATLDGLPQSPSEALDGLRSVNLAGISPDAVRVASAPAQEAFWSGVISTRQGIARRLSEPGITLEMFRRDIAASSEAYRSYFASLSAGKN